jgi:hypothetical protein
LALIWCLTMFAMMVGWHIYGKQNLSTETYKTNAGEIHGQRPGLRRQVHRTHRDRRQDAGGRAAARAATST